MDEYISNPLFLQSDICAVVVGVILLSVQSNKSHADKVFPKTVLSGGFVVHCVLCQQLRGSIFSSNSMVYGVNNFSNPNNVRIEDTQHSHVSLSRRLPLFNTACAVSRSERDADHQPDIAQLKRLRPCSEEPSLGLNTRDYGS